MQISEDLIKQITNAVMTEMQRRSEDPCVSSSDCASTAASAPVPSMAGRDRINPEKTDYSGYPKAAQGSDPKEVVIGVGAAFQREIKKTICGIPLDDVLTNVKAGIEEEGMNARVVKILDTSDVCFMRWKLPNCPVPESASASSPKERPSFTREISIRSPIWNCFHRRR